MAVSPTSGVGRPDGPSRPTNDTDADRQGSQPAGPHPKHNHEFAQFYKDEFVPLVKATMFMGARMDEAEDAAQAAMVAVYQRWSSIDNPWAYARTAARHAFIKAKAREHDWETREQAVPAREWSTDGGQEQIDEAGWVLEILSRLPTAQREAMAYLVDGFTPQEISNLVGAQPDAVRQNLLKARGKLREALRKEPSNGRPHEPRTLNTRRRRL